MRSYIPPISLSLAAALSTTNLSTNAFQIPRQRHHTSIASSSLSSYLDSLNDFHVDQPPPSWSPPPIPMISSNTESHHRSTSGISFHHAPIGFFDISQLTPVGPRKNADVGTPHDANKEMCDLGETCAGSWWCAAGGWPSPNQRGTTEVFYVLDGHGCLTDTDGMQHWFGPGDTVVLPKGWSGRWDVTQDVHKVWFVHEHDNIEETSDPIRVSVVPYHGLTAMELQNSYGVYKMSTNGEPEIFCRQIYSAGPTKVGSWICTPGGLKIENLNQHHSFHVLEGVLYITDEDSEMGQSRRCVAGDLVVLPKGWSGYFDVVETVRKLWTTLDV